MRSRRRLFLTLAIATSATSPAFCAQVSISNAWFRALPSGLPAGGYFSLHNEGSAPIALVAARSSACGMLMLHRSTESGGMSRMMDVGSVSVPARGTISFAPGGYHLMCMHPGAEMTPGRHVSVTLEFANHDTTAADFAVKNAAGE
jgi:hypothetical protein